MATRRSAIKRAAVSTNTKDCDKYSHIVANIMGVMLSYAVTATRVLIVRPCVSGTRSIFCKLSL